MYHTHVRCHQQGKWCSVLSSHHYCKPKTILNLKNAIIELIKYGPAFYYHYILSILNNVSDEILPTGEHLPQPLTPALHTSHPTLGMNWSLNSMLVKLWNNFKFLLPIKLMPKYSQCSNRDALLIPIPSSYLPLPTFLNACNPLGFRIRIIWSSDTEPWFSALSAQQHHLKSFKKPGPSDLVLA